MLTKPFFRSFAGGEITPELFGRLDLDKFQTGVANAENFWILPHGPAANRPGFEHVLQALSQPLNEHVRLIQFAYSATDTMVLELGHQYMRFHTNGATLLEAGQNIVSITQDSPALLECTGHGYSDGDWVFIDSEFSMTELDQQFFIVDNATADEFELLHLDGTAVDSTAFSVYSGGGTVARVYTISTPYTSAHLFDIHYTQSADVLTLVHPSYEPHELRRLAATNWTLTTITFAPSLAPGVAPTLAGIGPGGGTPITHTYVYTASTASGEESIASASANISRDLTVAGNAVTIDPPAVSGSARFNIYKLKNGLYGFIGQCDGSAFTDDNINPDTTQTPPEANNPFSGANNYPSAVTYFEQRRCFAATDNLPQHHFYTRSGTESNMTQSIPVRDDDAIIFRIAAIQQNRVRHLVPLSDLIALTVGAAWRITPSNGEFLTPAVAPKPQANVGASNVQPLLTESACLYVQARGARIRELGYGGEASNYGYRSLDATILAPHLVDGYTITDSAYCAAPLPTAWFVRSDGVLLCMTYVPDQNVRAWHHHVTDGSFESVCCVSEGTEDVLYAVVKREIDGDEVRFIERLHSRHFSLLKEAFFLDCGETYVGPATTVIRGLRHLRGKTVAILANGAVQPQQVVSDDGEITLDAEAAAEAENYVHVGLPYTSTLDTLPLTLEAMSFGQGSMKNVSKAHVRVAMSSGLFVGPKDGRLIEAKQRTDEPFGSPPDLMTKMVSVNMAPQWNQDGAVRVQQQAPLPLTVTALVLETATP